MKVIAYAFGPFSGKSLRLAPGMTVIFGPNEVGKSSWHAALYAGLCGMRRAKGQPRREDQEFIEKHQPWDNPEHWEVGAIVELDDTREIELRHNLVGKAECRALDDLGRDVTGEIINDGAPDGSTWVGLDRRSFLSTAFVRQAEVLQVLNDASLLQEHLQRAAANAGGRETAAAALARLDDFWREHVGSDRAPTKPLRRAKGRLEEANEAVVQARNEHEAFLMLQTRADESAKNARRIENELDLLEAAKARSDAETLSADLAKAQELSSRFPEGSPAEFPAEDELARTVDLALQAWDMRPEIPILKGPTSEELRNELARLPSAPRGDLEPDPEVIGRHKLYVSLKDLLEFQHEECPTKPVPVETGGATEEELRDLARDLDAPRPEVDPDLMQRFERKRRELESLSERRSRQRWVLVSSLIVTIAGVAAVALGGAIVPGLVLVAGGLAVIIWYMTSSGTAARLTLLEEVRSLENQLGEQRHALNVWTQQVNAARKRVRSLALPQEPESLRHLAEQLGEARLAERALERWDARRKELQESFDQAAKSLTEALSDHWQVVSGDLDEAIGKYVSGCRQRGLLAKQAAKRPDLEAQLANREEAERARQDAVTRTSEAENLLRHAARCCGCERPDLAELEVFLRNWRSRRAAALEELKTAHRTWTELQALLNGRTLEEMEAECNQKMELAKRLAAKVDPGELNGVVLPKNVEGKLRELRKEHSEANARAAGLCVQAEQMKAGLRSVAEAEEEVAAAEEDRRRIRDLDETLQRTKRFLEDAQDRIHRTVAPLLRETLNNWLPSVTSGRYEEALVDPETLEVKVRARGGRWRKAHLLSHGTAEQVYLLLRIAMVEHLTNGRGESCPIVFDDVMVQCDVKRKKAILNLLHALSAERQVILFTLEEEVAEWARVNLREARDRLEYLDATGIPP